MMLTGVPTPVSYTHLSGLLGRKLLAFTGSLGAHPDGERIKEFLHSRGVEPLELTDGPLYDVGSILPLLEEDARRRP